MELFNSELRPPPPPPVFWIDLDEIINTHKINSFQRVKRQSNDIVNTIIQLGSKLVPLVMSFIGPATGFTQPVDSPPTSAAATDLSKLPTIAGEASKPAAVIANKVSTPEKADKIGAAVQNTYLQSVNKIF